MVNGKVQQQSIEKAKRKQKDDDMPGYSLQVSCFPNWRHSHTTSLLLGSSNPKHISKSITVTTGAINNIFC
jgi:hypothetical protein